jgi:hypothetical protein
MDDEVVAVEPEERYGDEIICPWCGAKMEDSWEMARHDDCGITDCELCGKRYEWTQIVDVNYSTIPVTPPPPTPPAEPPAKGQSCENCGLAGKGNVYHYDDPKARESCEGCSRGNPDRWTPAQGVHGKVSE